MLRKIEYAGGNNRSFESAADSLERLAECSISGRHVERLTEKLGREREAQRDQDAVAMKERKLRSAYKQAPAVAVVMLDAGKSQSSTNIGEALGHNTDDGSLHAPIHG